MKKEALRISHMFQGREEDGYLDDFSMNLYVGEVLGIMGYRGNGKAELFHILAGRREFERGTLFLNENLVYGNKNSDTRTIVLIKSQLVLLENMSVADNMFHLRKHRKFSVWIHQKMYENLTNTHLREFGLDMHARTLVRKLSFVEKCMIVIIRAYIFGARIIILDDLLNNCTLGKIKKINGLLEQLKEKGVSFIISSYLMANLQICSDRILIMSKGRALKTIINNKRQEQMDIARLLLPKIDGEIKMHKVGEIFLEGKEICAEGLNNFNFSVRKGEVLAVIDYGKTTNAALYRFVQNPKIKWNGICLINGKEYTEREAYKMAFVNFSEDNQVIPYMSLQDNLCVRCFQRFARAGFINKTQMNFIRKEFLEWDKEYSAMEDNDCLRVNARDQMAIRLFGLKIQKPQILFCMEPFLSDYDVMTNRLREIIEELVEKGSSIVIFSSNLEQSYALADRFLMVQNGYAIGQYTKEEITN